MVDVETAARMTGEADEMTSSMAASGSRRYQDAKGEWHKWEKDFDGAQKPMKSITCAMGPTDHLEVFGMAVTRIVFTTTR
jgi:hypothetical protein